MIVPAYNAAATLGATLRSVTMQTRAPSEIVVVDDGSTDDTAAIAKAAGIRVIAQANAGPGPARNAGVAATTAPWIAFVDADDSWYPNRLARQWSLHERTLDIAIIASNYARTVERTGSVSHCFESCKLYANVPKLALPPDGVRIAAPAFAYWIAREQFVAPSTVLVRRDVLVRYPFAAVDLSQPRAYSSEDLEWYLRVARDYDIALIEAPLVRYAVRAESLSANSARLHYGNLKLGDRIAAAPDSYAAGAAASFATLRAHHQRLAAKAFLVARDPSSASAVLREPIASPIPPATRLYRMLAAIAATPPGRATMRSALELRAVMRERSARGQRPERRSIST